MKTVKTLGLPSGLRDVDEILSGFQKSDLIVLAARPSMAKTSFCLNMVANTAVKHKEPVLFFSLEMSSTQLAINILCSEAGVETDKVIRKIVSSKDEINLSNARTQISDSPIFIDETPGISISEISSKARDAAFKHGLSMVIVDYLQLMDDDTSSNCQGLKALARELNIPVLAVSQLSRSVETKSDKRPLLSDFRNPEAIEPSADVVMFLYRDEYYYKEKSEAKGLAELIVAKNRNGSVDTVTLAFSEEHRRFSDYDI